MSKELINRLSVLKLAEKTLKRGLDTSFAVKDKRKIFEELKKVKDEIELVKFKLQMEKELKNDKFRKEI